MRKTIFFLIFIICIATVSAQNETVVPTPTPILQKYSEEFYGEITYMDGNPVPSGNIIVSKDQYGNLMGNFTIRYDGAYGQVRPREDNLVSSVFMDPNNRTTRSMIIFVNFFVNDVRAKNTAEFRQGEITKFDIILPINKPTPIPTATPTPLPTTTIPTPVPTTIVTTVTTPPGFFDNILEPQSSDMTLLFYGLAAGGLIIFGIVITAAIQAILASRTNVDDVLGPEGRQK